MSFKFNSEKYEKVEEVMNRLRMGATCVQAVKKYDSAIRTWNPNKFDSERDFSGGRTDSYHSISKIYEYMKHTNVGGMSIVNEDDVGVSYMIMGDLDRRATLGENTHGIRGTFEWSYLNCNVVNHSGEMTHLPMTQHANDLMVGGFTDSRRVQQGTGFSVAGAQQMAADDMNTMSNLLRSASAGQCKYTRLVKGFLLFIDVATYGRQNFADTMDNVLEYNLTNVMRCFRASDRSYSYCSKPSSQAYIVLMMLIGMEYPFNLGGMRCRGNVRVPADAGSHYVIMRGVRNNNIYDCDITSELVWTGLVTYAREMGISDQLESSLITACSLYENRYLREVSLPRVESTIDLIRPAFVTTRMDDSARPMINDKMAKAVGRIHQMASFVCVKDIVMAAKLSSESGLNYSSIIRHYLSSQESIITRMTNWLTPISILTTTKEMKWMRCINDSDIDDFDALSIFEGLWLCDGETKSIERGGINMLYKGRRDMMSYNSFVSVLEEECFKMRILVDKNRIPTGRFSVKSRCLYSDSDWVSSTRKFESFEVRLNQECVPKSMKERREPVLKVRRLRKKSFSDTMSNYETESQVSRQERETRDKEMKAHMMLNQAIIDAEREKEKRAREALREEAERIRAEDEAARKDKSIKKIVGLELPFKFGSHEPSIRKVEVRDNILGSIQYGIKAKPEGVWEKKPDIKEDTDREDALYEKVEDNMVDIVHAERPKKMKNIYIWEELRMEHILGGGDLVPMREIEKAYLRPDEMTGNVEISWPEDLMIKLIKTKAWENTLKSRGIDITKKVMGDNKPYYYMHALLMRRQWGDVMIIDKYLSNTTIVMDAYKLIELIGQIDITSIKPREMLEHDSTSNTSRTKEDGLVLGMILAYPLAKDWISKNHLNSLVRWFKASKFEKASVKRTVEG